MRYEKGHKDATRQRILSVAADRFLKDGIAAAGLAGLMADAGLTHGGFYAHFASKEDLVRQMARQAAEATLERLAARGRQGISAVIHGYLSAEHRDHPGQGCVIASLAAELARHPPETRQAVSEGLDALVDLLAGLLPDEPEPERQQRATALFATMAGSLQMARAVPDPRRSDAILAAGIAAAHQLAGVADEFGPAEQAPSPSGA